MKFVHLITFSDTINAHLVRTKLESVGIPCILTNENFTNLMPNYYNIMGSGVQVLVPEDQLENAQEITQINDTKLECPNCKSIEVVNDIESKLWLKLFLIGISLIGFVPFGNMTNKYTCNNCRHKFSQNFVS